MCLNITKTIYLCKSQCPFFFIDIDKNSNTSEPKMESSSTVSPQKPNVMPSGGMVTSPGPSPNDTSENNPHSNT